MLRLEVDINLREGDRAIVIPSQSATGKELRVGERVVLYEPGMECEAVLRRGKAWPWVADILDGTIKEMRLDP